MLLNDIRIGKAYYVKNYGICLVIDIGLYDTCHSMDGARAIKWRGMTFNCGHRWYGPSNNVQKRRVVVMMIGSSPNVHTVAPSVVQYEVAEEQVRETLVADAYRRELDNRRESARRNKTDYLVALQTTLDSITGPVPADALSRIRYGEDPWVRVAATPIIKQMTMLWLRYHQKQGLPVNGIDDIESLIESLRDAEAGLSEVARQQQIDETTVREEIVATLNSAGQSDAVERIVIAEVA